MIDFDEMVTIYGHRSDAIQLLWTKLQYTSVLHSLWYY